MKILLSDYAYGGIIIVAQKKKYAQKKKGILLKVPCIWISHLTPGVSHACTHTEFRQHARSVRKAQIHTFTHPAQMTQTSALAHLHHAPKSTSKSLLKIKSSLTTYFSLRFTTKLSKFQLSFSSLLLDTCLSLFEFREATAVWGLFHKFGK